MKVDLEKINNIYAIGIKGSGVVGLVQILSKMGKIISGSDTNEKFFSEEILKDLGVMVFETFDIQNIPPNADLIIFSTAYNESNNIEFKAAKEKNIPMISYPEMLAQLFNQKYGIAVCGTHGKTTTTSLLAHIFLGAGLDPQAAVGSKVVNWKGNALCGKGEYFILEADEYQDKLNLYNPKGVILTSCDFDHPDYFETFEDYKNVFKKFVERIPKIGCLVVWGDSVDTVEISRSAQCDVVTYGFSEDCQFRCLKTTKPSGENDNSNAENYTQKFEVSYREKSLGEFEINLAGKHNILNSAAVIAMGYKLNLDLEMMRVALKDFRGTSRRFEYIGEKNGAILIDDYGHHPEEIKATLSAAREIYSGKNIWAIFHPHTFTRTKALLSEFSQSFDNADKVIILDIYGSAREAQGGVHSKDLVALINKYDFGKAEYISTIDEAVDYLKNEIGNEDVVISIGAGNVWEVTNKLKEI